MKVEITEDGVIKGYIPCYEVTNKYGLGRSMAYHLFNTGKVHGFRVLNTTVLLEKDIENYIKTRCEKNTGDKHPNKAYAQRRKRYDSILELIKTKPSNLIEIAVAVNAAYNTVVQDIKILSVYYPEIKSRKGKFPRRKEYYWEEANGKEAC